MDEPTNNPQRSEAAGHDRAVDGLMREAGRGIDGDDERFVESVLARIDANAADAEALDWSMAAAQRGAARRSAPRRREGGRWMAWAAAACLAVGVGVALVMNQPERPAGDLAGEPVPAPAPHPTAPPWPAPPIDTAVAVLDDASHGVLIRRGGKTIRAHGGAPLRSGDELVCDGFFTAAGLRYGSEATTVRLSGNGRVRLIDDRGAKHIHLEAGRIVCDVGRQDPDRPMTIHTPHAVATVLGTRFAIDAAGGRTNLQVFEGRVRVASGAGVGEPVEVAGGQMVDIVSGTAPRRARQAPTVLALHLIDADTGRPIAGYSPLAEGQALSMAGLPTRRLNVVASTAGAIGAVRFTLRRSGRQKPLDVQIEKNPPYTMTGNEPVQAGRKVDYDVWTPEPGSYRLIVEPLAEPRGGSVGSALERNFTVAP